MRNRKTSENNNNEDFLQKHKHSKSSSIAVFQIQEQVRNTIDKKSRIANENLFWIIISPACTRHTFLIPVH